jgi:cyclopropane fatty-acyl-phospholipid synthase-like methyltransferase
MIESRTIEPGRTLQVGCGTGTNAIYLAQHGFEVVGVDVSRSMSTSSWCNPGWRATGLRCSNGYRSIST